MKVVHVQTATAQIAAYDLIRDYSPTNRIIIETETGIPTTDREQALRLELETVRRSIRYCREVLGIRREPGD